MEEGSGILDAEIIFQGKRIQLRKLFKTENSMVLVQSQGHACRATQPLVRMPRLHSAGKAMSATNGAGKIRYP